MSSKTFLWVIEQSAFAEERDLELRKRVEKMEFMMESMMDLLQKNLASREVTEIENEQPPVVVREKEESFCNNTFRQK